MSHLTQQDLENFGPELLDVAQRAAQHAVGPELQQLRAENEELRHGMSRAVTAELNRALDAAVPNWQQINNDPSFHSWLLQPDLLSGVIRDRLLKDAAHAGDAQRLIRFFRGFLEQAGLAPAGQAPQRTPRRTRARTTADGRPIYTREQITRMWERRRQGRINDADWARWEHEIVAAGRDGRIVGALDIDGIPVSR